MFTRIYVMLQAIQQTENRNVQHLPVLNGYYNFDEPQLFAVKIAFIEDPSL